MTKPGQTLEFLLWGTIVPLNFLVGYHCSIVASTPQPTVYASNRVNTGKRGPPIVPLLFHFSQHLSYVLYTFGKRGPFSNWGPYCSFCYKSPVWMPKQTHRRLHAVLWGLSIVLSFVILLPNTPWLCARKCYGDIKMSPQLRWSHTLTQLWGHPCPHNSATARAHTHTHTFS